MLEKEVERKLIKGVHLIGGRAYKFVSPGNDGVPDRIVVLPGGRIIFVELKTETGKLASRQKIQMKSLTRLGCEVWTLWGEEDVKKFLAYLQEGGDPDGVQAARLSEAGCLFYP